MKRTRKGRKDTSRGTNRTPQKSLSTSSCSLTLHHIVAPTRINSSRAPSIHITRNIHERVSPPDKTAQSIQRRRGTCIFKPNSSLPFSQELTKPGLGQHNHTPLPNSCVSEPDRLVLPRGTSLDRHHPHLSRMPTQGADSSPLNPVHHPSLMGSTTPGRRSQPNPISQPLLVSLTQLPVHSPPSMDFASTPSPRHIRPAIPHSKLQSCLAILLSPYQTHHHRGHHGYQTSQSRPFSSSPSSPQVPFKFKTVVIDQTNTSKANRTQPKPHTADNTNNASYRPSSSQQHQQQQQQQKKAHSSRTNQNTTHPTASGSPPPPHATTTTSKPPPMPNTRKTSHPHHSDTQPQLPLPAIDTVPPNLMQPFLTGAFQPNRFRQHLIHQCVFEDDADKLEKSILQLHQHCNIIAKNMLNDKRVKYQHKSYIYNHHSTPSNPSFAVKYMLSFRDNDGACPLFYALPGHHLRMISTLIRNGSSISQTYQIPDAEIDDTADSAFHNVSDDTALETHTLLTIAISMGMHDVIKLLLESGTNPNASVVQPRGVNLPIYRRPQQPHGKLPSSPLSSYPHPSPPKTFTHTPLTAAVLLKDAHSVKLLLEYGADPEIASGSYGYPLLSVAIYLNDTETLKVLLDFYCTRANPNYANVIKESQMEQAKVKEIEEEKKGLKRQLSPLQAKLKQSNKANDLASQYLEQLQQHQQHGGPPPTIDPQSIDYSKVLNPNDLAALKASIKQLEEQIHDCDQRILKHPNAFIDDYSSLLPKDLIDTKTNTVYLDPLSFKTNLYHNIIRVDNDILQLLQSTDEFNNDLDDLDGTEKVDDCTHNDQQQDVDSPDTTTKKTNNHLDSSSQEAPTTATATTTVTTTTTTTTTTATTASPPTQTKTPETSEISETPLQSPGKAQKKQNQTLYEKVKEWNQQNYEKLQNQRKMSLDSDGHLGHDANGMGLDDASPLPIISNTVQINHQTYSVVIGTPPSMKTVVPCLHYSYIITNRQHIPDISRFVNLDLLLEEAQSYNNREVQDLLCHYGAKNFLENVNNTSSRSTHDDNIDSSIDTRTMVDIASKHTHRNSQSSTFPDPATYSSDSLNNITFSTQFGTTNLIETRQGITHPNQPHSDNTRTSVHIDLTEKDITKITFKDNDSPHQKM